MEEKKKLEKYVQDTVRQLMPNFSQLIDPLLAARFLASAGSMERLARMPASTIQLLGAEKSLFRHLKEQGKSPKFGIIFIDSHIQNAPEEKRGKIARILSSKLMLAARIDFYSGRDDSEKLKKEFNEDLAKI
jgi:nucleolar protein 56